MHNIRKEGVKIIPFVCVCAHEGLVFIYSMLTVDNIVQAT